MLELPEAAALAVQFREVAAGRRVRRVEAMHSPHKWAWFNGDPAGYGALLESREVKGARALGGMAQLDFDGASLVMGDGVRLAWLEAGEKRPEKHQLLLEFEDDAALVCSVQMYGGMWAFDEKTGYDNPYYRVAVEKPSPLADGFDRPWFDAIVKAAPAKLSAKGLLATEQRIPGLGNGVLQDILFNARVHPKRKAETLAAGDADRLYASIKSTLAEMAARGGRDTEKDLFGCAGGYKTLLSAKTAAKPCPVCGGPIVKQAYMGGSVYFCPVCQPL